MASPSLCFLLKRDVDISNNERIVIASSYRFGVKTDRDEEEVGRGKGGGCILVL